MAEGGQFLGFTGEAAHTAKVMAGGGAGASLLLYLRHPGTLTRAVLLFAISMLLAWLFGDRVGHTGLAQSIGLGPVECGALVALTGKAAANGLLRAVERFDFSGLLPGKKGE